MEGRPENIMDSFELHSRKIREEKFRFEEHHFRATYIQPHSLEKAKGIVNQFKLNLNSKLNQDGEDFDKELSQKIQTSDFIQLSPLLEACGVGMHRTDSYYISLSIEQISRDEKFQHCRFWGKIYGLRNNYWILEASLTEQEIESRKNKEAENMSSNETSLNHSSIINNQENRISVTSNNKTDDPLARPSIPELPLSNYTSPQETPSEQLGEGVNRFVYFVCNRPYACNWQELPTVTPKQIIVSRQIKKMLTGDLNADILSFPTFPGKEKHLLRAMIARITAGTFVAPLDYWTTRKPKEGDDDEEEEEVSAYQIIVLKYLYLLFY